MAPRARALALGALLAGCVASGEDAIGAPLRGSRRRLQLAEGERHASAHLKYAPPHSVNYAAKSWFMKLTPKHSSEDTFFNVLGQNMGYAGLQQKEAHGLWFQGKAIFSVWDNGCNHLMNPDDCPPELKAEIVECGRHAVCTTFGGEGTGLKTFIDFHEWSVEQSYSFVIQNHLEENNKVLQECYFYAPELGGWSLLAKLRASVDGSWQPHNLYSFVEQWSTRSGGDVRFARFGNSFMEPQAAAPGDYNWVQVMHATWSHTDASNEVVTNLGGNVTSGGTEWGLGIGGDLVRTIQDGHPLTLTQPSPLPDELIQWAQMRQNGQLPTGCLGHTCSDTRVLQWLSCALTLEYIPITIIILLVVSICMCTGAYKCVATYLGFKGKVQPAGGPRTPRQQLMPQQQQQKYGYEQPRYGYEQPPNQYR